MSIVITDLNSVIENYEVIIAYQPLPDEPLINLPVNKIIYIVPQSKDSNPFQLADDLAKQYFDQSVAILIPGQKFDNLGNRIGRGGGWYDRFLSRAPSDWLKVGVCFKDQVSNIALDVKEYDQSVNNLYVVNSKEQTAK